MKNKEFTLKNNRGQEIVGQYWQKTRKPKAAICLLHGFGEHTNRYQHWGKWLVAQGFHLAAIDLIGHGRSAGKRGCIRSRAALHQDVTLFIAYVEKLFPSLPLLLYGHSMGGNIALWHLTFYPNPIIKAAIVTSPWLALVSQPTRFQKILAIIGNICMPHFTQPAQLDPNDLSTDMAVGKTYLADPLVHNHMSAKLFWEIDTAKSTLFEKVASLTIPLLLAHGTADKITDFQTTKQYATKLARTNDALTFLPIADKKHELHNEPDNALFLQGISTFLTKYV